MRSRLLLALTLTFWSRPSPAATPALPPPASDERPSEDTWERAEAAQSAGHSADAADLYELAALTSTDEGLQALALLSAADAAVDAGQPKRARELLEAARRSPGATGIHDLIATLDGQLRAQEDAARSLALASEGPSSLAPSHASTMSSSLGVASRATAPAVRPAVAGGALDGFVLASVGSGYDSNVSISAASETNGDAAVATNDGDWFATALLMVNVAHRWNRGGTSELTYSFFQIAYPQAVHDSYNLQDHLAELTHRWPLSTSIRAFATARAGATFSGIRGGLSPFLHTAGVEAGIVLDESPRARLRATVGLARRQMMEASYDYLTGTRWEGALEQEWRPASWLLSGGVSYRQELVGEIRDALDSAPPGQAGVPCDGCALEAVTPYSHRALGAGVRARSPADRRFRAGARLRVEDRLYAPAFLEAMPAAGAAAAFAFRRRHDRRFSGGIEVSAGQTSEVSLRYDVTVNRSRVEGADSSLCSSALICHPLDAENHDYVRHMLTLGVDYGAWFL